MNALQCTPSTAAKRWHRCGCVLLLSFAYGIVSAAADTLPEAGRRIMTERSLGNCVACHALPGQTGVLSTMGPSLQGVGARYSEGQLLQWVVDARQIHPNTLMPPFGSASGLNRVASAEPLLNPEQIRLVVATLAQWR